MRFVLNELHADGFGDIPALADFTPDLTEAVLRKAARFIRTCCCRSAAARRGRCHC
jgi:hypothetical protein